MSRARWEARKSNRRGGQLGKQRSLWPPLAMNSKGQVTSHDNGKVGGTEGIRMTSAAVPQARQNGSVGLWLPVHKLQRAHLLFDGMTP
ncbi:hypothetical protein SETIT_3G224600v2 [Setaria italica]|uniref:Uncharacterized protein n=1 Tax=Setaria italica TaxID=4555 RepID=A0A368QIC6_SETIT|nr:hypothetical protein SETIT_3G224600v2 [Setaria italica]